ncbi:hypothetical protein IGJ92_002937 [Enterococcus sp. AZ127]
MLTEELERDIEDFINDCFGFGELALKASKHFD